MRVPDADTAYALVAGLSEAEQRRLLEALHEELKMTEGLQARIEDFRRQLAAERARGAALEREMREVRARIEQLEGPRTVVIRNLVHGSSGGGGGGRP
jgi:DNA-binding IclR family transcriptional regulator